MGQMWCANTLSPSSQLAPRVQYARPVFFVRAEWHGDLWSVKPPCLWRIPAFTSVFPVFNSVAWWHTVPVSSEMVLGPCGKEWRVVPPFERRETKLWMRNQGRRGKWVTVLCLCSTHFIRPRGSTAGPVQRGGDTPPHSSTVPFISEGKPINNSGFPETYFLFLESKHENTLKHGDVYFRLELSLEYLLPGWFAFWIDV